MSRSLVRIENHDSDRRFRDKVNANFAAVAGPASIDGASIQLIGDSKVVSDILLAMADKADRSELVSYAGQRRSGRIQAAGLSIDPGGHDTLPEVSLGSAYPAKPRVLMTADTPGVIATSTDITTDSFVCDVFNASDTTLTAVNIDWLAVP